MLAKLLDRVISDLISRLAVNQVNFATLVLRRVDNNPTCLGQIQLNDLLDGYLWATPKNRTPSRKIWARKYGSDNWKYGGKLWKPRANIVSCLECGSFHEFHTICRNCFNKVSDESKKIIAELRRAWDGKAIDKEVHVLYQGEDAKNVEHKRIVEIDRPRPLWFTPNLSQASANPGRLISGPSRKYDDLRVHLKNKPDN